MTDSNALAQRATIVPTPSAYVDQKWNGRERYFDPRNLDHPVELLLDDHDGQMHEAARLAVLLTRDEPAGDAIERAGDLGTVATAGAVQRATAATYARPAGLTTAPPKWDPNQGPVGACTAFSILYGLVWGGRHPRLLKVLTSPGGYEFALSFYRFIQSIDREEGRYYSEGATTLASAKAAKRLGWIDGYSWFYDVAGFIAAQRARLTTIIGADWPEGFDDPDPIFGVMRFKGAVLGGHQFLMPYTTLHEALAKMAQTWGRRNWGINGIGAIPLADVGKALAAYGDGLVLDEHDDADPQALISLRI